MANALEYLRRVEVTHYAIIAMRMLPVCQDCYCTMRGGNLELQHIAATLVLLASCVVKRVSELVRL